VLASVFPTSDRARAFGEALSAAAQA
jgi:hypothetical protein